MLHGKINANFKFTKPEPLLIKLPNPNGIWLLVRELSLNEEQKTQGGVTLYLGTDIAQDPSNELTIGYVEEVGSLAYTHEKFKGVPFCKKGDYILYGRFQGTDFMLKDEKIKFLADDKPLMTFTEQELIDLEILNKETN